MENEKRDKVEDPFVPYGKKRLTFFNSFEEEEAQLANWRSLTPLLRLEEHYMLSLQVFSGFEKYTGNRLIFD